MGAAETLQCQLSVCSRMFFFFFLWVHFENLRPWITTGHPNGLDWMAKKERHAYIVTVEYQLKSISDIDLKNTLTCNSSVLRALKCCLHYTKAIFHPLIS